MLKGGQSLALESTILLHFIPGNYRPPIILGTGSKEPQRAIRGRRDKAINVADGRITGTDMKKGNRRHVH